MSSLSKELILFENFKLKPVFKTSDSCLENWVLERMKYKGPKNVWSEHLVLSSF